ncbi:putative basic amino acid antiporter YfcC [Duganella sp. BJB488]|uniref:YfcC family protein n=1 Tax=unclassified Duganella TaxID=2636909 RepID=UPI000E34559E|nr:MULTISPECIES: YfcC family protein [unclassified Duganella]NVD69251.1 putative basic amino acid antiporter YfcC [Duganella sp. BJB1802]RFP16624.1 putative basic amino acid antiporter YfcC [Duganella sp. BJB489]RFP20950.1 putative basic amino acid antiporter YfcC [Duganella sp. BJB488]RFP31987.1 putative basic amino acid antiporter YfcC [Duganella sp. BJB480]
MTTKKFKLPHTFVLLFIILALIAGATWLVPGGKYDTHLVNGKQLIDPDSFHYIASAPQGLAALMKAPINGFVDAALIIGFVLIVGGAFAVLQKTEAVDSMIKSLARAHDSSVIIQRALIPVFVTMFSIGGATFGMNEEAIPFILIFVPLALALGYDTITGVSIPFLGSQVGFSAAFLNPFNVGIAQGIAGVPVFSGWAYRVIVWVIATAVTIVFLMWYAARVKKTPELSPTYALDQDKRREQPHGLGEFHGMTGRHKLVLAIFVGALVVMVGGVVLYDWYIHEIAALFLTMGIVIGLVGGLDSGEIVEGFIQGARDLVGTALVIALARGTMILARDAHIIDTMLHALMPLVQSSSPIFSAWKMFGIQTVINFFIHSGSGQAALTMPIMAPLADLVGVTRQTAILAFQFGEFTTPMIPTSGITVGVLALARIPWITWAKWMVPLQLIYAALALALLVPPCLMNWQ